jgi:LysR family cys regulon transcriptional activator
MNFQQLRSVREAVRRRFNLTEVAAALNTSQPGVSRQIRELEDELGFELFARAGKRLTGLTEPGTQVLPIIERMLLDAENLRRASQDLTARQRGRLSVAATHSQARYALPGAVSEFARRYPEVRLRLHQGSPRQVAEMILSGEADIGIATEALAEFADLVTLPCYRWTHCVLVRRGHPLADGQPLTLERLAEHPLITYEEGFTGRAHIDRGFQEAGLAPDVLITAMDADVIKTYVSLGLGVGIVASIAWDETRDADLVGIDARHLFAINVTRLGIRRGAFLRGYTYAFIEAFVPSLDRRAIDEALAAGPGAAGGLD